MAPRRASEHKVFLFEPLDDISSDVGLRATSNETATMLVQVSVEEEVD